MLARNGIRNVDFVKLDTQGSELEILKGGERILSDSVLGIKVEVEFIEIYKNQPLFGDVDSFLRRQGFELIDLRRAFWKRKDHTYFSGKGQLVFGDALYLKNIDIFLEMVGREKSDAVLQKILNFTTMCVVYKVYDYAMSILDEVYKRGLIDDAYFDIIAEIKRFDRYRNRYSKLPLSHHVGHILGRMQRRLIKGWAYGDGVLGNR